MFLLFKSVHVCMCSPFFLKKIQMKHRVRPPIHQNIQWRKYNQTHNQPTLVCGAGRLIQETTDLHAVLGLASIAIMKQQPNPINPHLWMEPTDCVFDCGSYRFCRCPGQGLFATMSPTSNWIHPRTCVRNIQIDSHRFPRCPPWAQSQLCHMYMPMAIHPARIEVATFSVLGWRHSH